MATILSNKQLYIGLSLLANEAGRGRWTPHPQSPRLRYARCQWSDNKHYRRCSAKKRLAEDYLAIWHWENSVSHVINTNRRMSRCCCAHQQRGDARPLEGGDVLADDVQTTDNEGQTDVHFPSSLVRQSFVNVTNKRLFLYWLGAFSSMTGSLITLACASQRLPC